MGFRPSGDGWGLAAHPLELASQTAEQRRRIGCAPRCTVLDFPIFVLVVLYTVVRTAVDRAIYPFYPVWRRRAAIAWATVRGESVVRWPWLLRKIWLERPSARTR